MKKTIDFYRNNPEELLKKKPFIRGNQYIPSNNSNGNPDTTDLTQMLRANLPKITGNVISQEVYIQEYNPDMHSIKHNKSIPDFKITYSDGQTVESSNIIVTSARQKNIHAKQCLHLCGNDMDFKMLSSLDEAKTMNLLKRIYNTIIGKQERNLTDSELKAKALFIRFKQEWVKRNMKQYRDKAISIQKKTGDCGILFYMKTGADKSVKVRVRPLSFADGYVIIPNYDDFGEKIAVSIYYSVDNLEIIQTYTDTDILTWHQDKNAKTENGTPDKTWKFIGSEPHGFSIIPLLYKRGYVAWEFAQSAIEMREVIMAINSVVMKRFGWHWLWINADIENITIDSGDGVVIVSNPDMGNEKADAKTIEFPEAIGIEKMLEALDDEIQTASSTTMILPKYIKAGNDVSGTAVKVTMSMDYELATQTANDWQEFCDDFVYLFAQGLGNEEKLINKYTDLGIRGSIKIWMPESESAYNQMVGQMKQMGIISQETATELCTLSSPDESERLLSEAQRKKEEEKEQLEQSASLKQNENKTQSSTQKEV